MYNWVVRSRPEWARVRGQDHGSGGVVVALILPEWPGSIPTARAGADLIRSFTPQAADRPDRRPGRSPPAASRSAPVVAAAWPPASVAGLFPSAASRTRSYALAR